MCAGLAATQEHPPCEKIQAFTILSKVKIIIYLIITIDK